MTREFRTEIYLLAGDELRVVRSEGGIEEQPMDVGGPVEYSPVHSPRGGLAMGGFPFFVPTVSRPNSVSSLTVESRPTSQATTMVRVLWPPTCLPLVVAAGVHSPMVPLGGQSIILWEGRLPVPQGDGRLVLTDVYLVDILKEPWVDHCPEIQMGQRTDCVRGGPWGGAVLRVKCPNQFLKKSKITT